MNKNVMPLLALAAIIGSPMGGSRHQASKPRRRSKRKKLALAKAKAQKQARKRQRGR